MSANSTAWSIDSTTMCLVAPDSLADPLTAQEFREQQWPPCPVCGTTIEVEGIETRRLEDEHPTLLHGTWECPNGCTPGRESS